MGDRAEVRQALSQPALDADPAAAAEPDEVALDGGVVDQPVHQFGQRQLAVVGFDFAADAKPVAPRLDFDADVRAVDASEELNRRIAVAVPHRFDRPDVRIDSFAFEELDHHQRLVHVRQRLHPTGGVVGVAFEPADQSRRPASFAVGVAVGLMTIAGPVAVADGADQRTAGRQPQPSGGVAEPDAVIDDIIAVFTASSSQQNHQRRFAGPHRPAQRRRQQE